MDQLINYRLWHASWHVTTIHFICIYTWFCDFIGPKYRSRTCDNTHTVIYISAKKKYWLQVRILNFYHKLFPWAWMIPLSLSLTAVAYMSIVMFVCDDYTTCLKFINCITHVMIILGPWRNNNKFQAGTVNFFVCVHAAHVMLHTHVAYAS